MGASLRKYDSIFFSVIPNKPSLLYTVLQSVDNCELNWISKLIAKKLKYEMFVNDLFQDENRSLIKFNLKNREKKKETQECSEIIEYLFY